MAVTQNHRAGYAGYLDQESFPRIVDILTETSVRTINPESCSDCIPEPSTEVIKEILSECPAATVTHNVTGDEVFLPERRKCKRLTFTDRHAINSLTRELEASIYRWTPVTHLHVESSHGDILLYEKGEYFDWHRDTVPEPPAALPGAKYYTLLLGLVRTERGGDTCVRMSDTGVVHAFNHTCVPAGFVLFRSDVYHRGSEVLQGCKMVLKLDFWCTIDPKVVYICDCVSCRDYRYDQYDPEEEDDHWCNGYHLDY